MQTTHNNIKAVNESGRVKSKTWLTHAQAICQFMTDIRMDWNMIGMKIKKPKKINSPISFILIMKKVGF